MFISRLIKGFASVCIIAAFSLPTYAISLYGTTDIHDPSTIVKDGDTYWTFGTGGGANNFPINALYSRDLVNWSRGSSPVPRNTYPSWIDSKVPGFDGNFWAPDLIEMNGRYYLYYSAFSASSGMHSAIGVMVTDSLNNPNWRDLGMVVSTVDEPNSSQGEPVNAIDAGLFRDESGNVWMVYGSHYAGIYMRPINPDTGLLLNRDRYPVVGSNGGWNEFEAAQVKYLNGYYYMFVNLGECCQGNQSTYYVVVGRSTSPTGPYLDKNGVDMWHYGGSSVLSSSGIYIGPGHFGYLDNHGQHLASIHYYDGRTADGWPGRLDLLEMNMVDGWPTFTRNFSLHGSSQPVPNGRVNFRSVHSGKALEVSGADTADGANVVQWGYWGGTNQQWDLEYQGNGIYAIRAAHSGKSLDVYNFSTEDGGEILQWSYWGGEPQQWRIQSAGDGKYAIISAFSGKALDVFEWSTEDGGDIRQWEYWGGAPQLWHINYVD
jgi:arabinan endo-1,5-alpha-L-arabinosidase